MSLADTHLRQVLAAMAGPAARPRDDRTAAVAALVEQRARVLVVQATGWGKSAIHRAATSALRAGGRRGPTLIVSPLLALLRGQVAAARQAGLCAASVNSTNLEDWDVFDHIAGDRLDVLPVSPERLGNEGFARRLRV